MGMMMDLFKKGNYVDNPYSSFYEISARDMEKNIINMKDYHRKVLLVVNVSPFDKNSKTEFEKLKDLKEALGDNFEVLAFPSGELEKVYISDREMKQEINSREFIDKNKIKIFNRIFLNGNEICEVFKFCLRNSSFFRLREGTSIPMNKNFVKFLIDKNGKVYSQYLPDTENVENLLLEDAKKLLLDREESSKSDYKKEIKIRSDFISYDKFI